MPIFWRVKPITVGRQFGRNQGAKFARWANIRVLNPEAAVSHFGGVFGVSIAAHRSTFGGVFVSVARPPLVDVWVVCSTFAVCITLTPPSKTAFFQRTKWPSWPLPRSPFSKPFLFSSSWHPRPLAPLALHSNSKPSTR